MTDYVPTTDGLADSFRYMIWGDRQCLAVARSVPAVGYVADQGFSFGSCHRLLVHMLAAQRMWLARCHGEVPRRMWDGTDYPTLDSVEAAWPAVHDGWLAFIAAQMPATLAAPLAYRNAQGEPFTLPLGGVLLHVADHATYHRGQLNSMARRAGGTPRPIMRYTYLIEGDR